jgi:hypothetical protein
VSLLAGGPAGANRVVNRQDGVVEVATRRLYDIAELSTLVVLVEVSALAVPSPA